MIAWRSGENAPHDMIAWRSGENAPHDMTAYLLELGLLELGLDAEGHPALVETQKYRELSEEDADRLADGIVAALRGVEVES